MKRFGHPKRVWHLRHLTRPLHSHLCTEKSIDATHPRKFLTLQRRVEMHHLIAGMHAGVGAASANYLNWVFNCTNLRESAL